MFLQEGVFFTVAAVGFFVDEVLVAVEFDSDSFLGEEEIDFHFAVFVERDRETGVEVKFVLGGGEGLQALVEKFLAGTPGAVGTLSSLFWRTGGVDEKSGEWRINAVTDEALDTGGVVVFPLWIDRQRHLGWPTWQGVGGEEDGVADFFVTRAAAVEHTGEHGHIEVRVIEDTDHFFADVESVESARILGDGATPGDGHGEKKGVEAGVVKTLTDKPTCGENDSGLGLGDRAQGSDGGFQFLGGHAAFEGDDVGEIIS